MELTIVAYVSALTAVCSLFLSITIRRSTLTQTALESAFEIQLGRFEKRLKEDLQRAFVGHDVYALTLTNQQKQIDNQNIRLSRVEEHVTLVLRSRLITSEEAQ